MRVALRPIGLALAFLWALAAAHPALATEVGTDARSLSAQSLDECERGRRSTDRAEREAAFERGLAIAERAVALDDESAPAHFAVFCNRGELLRIDGEKLTSVFAFRSVMHELDRTLDLDPGYLKAMASKGILLVRLPAILGGDAKAGEALLREVIERDPTALASRLTMAERCRERGELKEARAYAGRALEIASEQGRVDKVEEAQATLAKIDSTR